MQCFVRSSISLNDIGHDFGPTRELRTVHPRIKPGKYQKSQACDVAVWMLLCVLVP